MMREITWTNIQYLVWFRFFRGPIFRKPVTGQELFFCCFLQQTGSNANKITLFLQNLEISRNYCENLKEDSNIVCTSVLWVPISGPRSYRPGLHHLLIILLIWNSLYVINRYMLEKYFFDIFLLYVTCY